MNLILLEASELDSKDCAHLDDRRAEHIRGVLKAKKGDEIRIGIVDGLKGVGRIEEIKEGSVVLRCVLEERIPERPAVDLLLALPRPKVMKRLWAQLAALGVGRIMLTNAEKVERVYFDTHVLEPETYRALLIEGLQQAQDTRLPEVRIHKRLKVLVEDQLDDLCPAGVRLVGHPRAGETMASVVAEKKPDRVLLAVGPEGGWTDYELKLLQEHGFKAVGMGPRILRTDTACIALLAMVHQLVSLPFSESLCSGNWKSEN